MHFKPKKSFIGMFIENYDILVKRVRWRLNGHFDVDDIVQDTFLKIQNIPSDKNIENPKSYLFRIADNLALDRMRQHHYESRFIQDDGTIEYFDKGPSPEVSTDYRQRLACLTRVIEALPPRQKEAFILHKFEGLSHAKVADRMNISVSAVEKLIMKALLSCRNEMDDLLNHEK